MDHWIESNRIASLLTKPTTSNQSISQGNKGVRTGKWYWEVTLNENNEGCSIGVAVGIGFDGNHGQVDNNWTYRTRDGVFKYGGSNLYTGETSDAGDVLGFALDADAGGLTVYKSGVNLGYTFTGISVLSGLPDIFVPVIGNAEYGYATLNYKLWTIAIQISNLLVTRQLTPLTLKMV